MADRERIVGLAVKAKDEFSKVFVNLQDMSHKAQLTLKKDTLKALADQQQAINAVVKAMKEAGAAGNTRGFFQLAEQKAKLIERAKQLRDGLDAVGIALKRNAGTGSFKAFEQAANSVDILDNKIARLKAQLSGLDAPLSKAQADRSVRAQFGSATGNTDVEKLISLQSALRAQIAATVAEKEKLLGVSTASSGEMTAEVPKLLVLTEEMRTQTQVQDKLTKSTKDLTSARRKMGAEPLPNFGRNGYNGDPNVGKKGDAQTITAFGLKPWQLTNLGYQVNDIFSGIAMGQKPTQIVAQQLGQFIQIWPKTMEVLATNLPVIGAAAVALGTLALAMSRVNDVAESERQFTAELALNADGALYNAKTLAQMAQQVDDLGVSLDDARSMLRDFVGMGISQDAMLPLVKMAQQLAAVTGEKVPDAAKRLATAFAGNVDSVRELDKELNFLTEDQLQHLRAMEASGHQTEALAEAQDILRGRLEASIQPQGDWEEMLKNWGTAYRDFLKALDDSGLVKLAAEGLGLVAKGISGVANIASAGANTLRDIFGGNPIGTSGVTDKIADPTEAEFAQRAIKIKAIQDAAKSVIEYIKGSSKEFQELNKDALSAAQSQLDKANEDWDTLIAQMAEYRNAKEGANNVAGGLDNTEALKKLQDDILQSVIEQAKAAQDSVAAAGASEKTLFIQKGLQDAINEAKKEGLTIDQQHLDSLKESLGVLYDAQKAAKDSAALFTDAGIGDYSSKVVAIESGGVSTATNSNSSSVGIGQFIESTWLRMFKQYFPDHAAGMTDAMILELRKDNDLSRKMIELYAQENAKLLQSAGVAVNQASLYLAHFLGPQGAISVLTAQAGTALSSVLSPATMSANPFLANIGTTDQLQAWAAGKMNQLSGQTDAAARIAALEAERAKTEQTLNDNLAARMDAQKQELGYMSMQGREAAIQKAIAEEELKFKEKGLTLSEAQRKQIAEITGAAYDQQNIETETNRLMEKRQGILDAINIAAQNGDQGKVDDLNEQLRGVDTELQNAINSAIAFWQTIGGPEAENAIAKLENLRDGTKDFVQNVIPTTEQLNNQIIDGAGSAFSNFAQKLAQGEGLAKSFWSSMIGGVGDFLISLGEALVKQALLNALIGSAGMSGSATPGGFVTAALAAVGINHTGGMAGASGVTRMVDPSIFTNAARYHSGGIPGLKPGEVPIIAMNTEEVITADDPRHVKNGGRNSAPVKLKNVNVFDPADLLHQAMQTEIGEQVMINFVNRNRKALGISS